MDFKEFKKKFEKITVKEYPNEVNQTPIVSICVQTYNQEKYITDCLESILFQQIDYPIEILIGEDNSSDGTREICIKYAKKYPDKIRLFLHHRKNNIRIDGQPSANFNALYNLYSSRGKYIVICEGDDYWNDSNKLQKQINLLENSNYTASFHDARLLLDNGKRQLFSEKYDSVLKSSVNFSSFLKSDWLIPSCTFVFRKEELTVTQLFTETRYLDFLIFSDILLKGDAYYLPQPMATYRKNNHKSITNTKGIFEPLIIKTTMIRFLLDLLEKANPEQQKAITSRIDRELIHIRGYANLYENSKVLKLIKKLNFI